MNRPFLAIAALAAAAAPAFAQSNIDPSRKFAWSENCGWTNWRDALGGAQGVDVGPIFLKGFIYGENIGWINTGNGSGPYANTDGSNFGVNILASGFLSGLAWGENVGWINFGTQPTVGPQGARFDSVAGRFRGYAWGENIGWINLDDPNAFVALVPPCCLGNADKLPGSVTFADITSILQNFNVSYGPSSTGAGDANCDGSVNFADVTNVLQNWLNNCS
ncbi:MAG: hypothetical protein SFZ24_03070 [Planctomycetota bacterium]|nr:hypothetical protein [Planctomycetota bacterium]